MKRTIEKRVTELFGTVFRHLPVNLRIPAKRKVFDRYFAWRDIELSARTYFGASVGVRFPDIIQTTIFLTGVWERAITSTIEKALRPGDIFVDVGANIGYYTLLASQRVGASGKVFSFEASPSIFRELRRNIARNRAVNVSAVNIAVSDKVGTCQIYLAKDSNLGHSTMVPKVAEADGHSVEATVSCAPLPEIMPVDDLLDARFVKLDVEGAERLVVEGTIDLLPKFSKKTSWLIEFSPSFSPNGQRDTDWMFEAFVRQGYLAYKIPNDYSDSFLLGNGLSDAELDLLRITEPPSDSLCDVVFRRSD